MAAAAAQQANPPSIAHGHRYVADYLDPQEAAALLVWLQTEVSWQQEPLHFFGRRHLTPRLVAWYGEAGLDYRYSRRSHPARGWPDVLHGLQRRLSEQAGATFNFVLLNRYRDGDDCMGWHRDDEPGVASTIASISLGATRRFLLRGAEQAGSLPMDLESGSLLLFDGSARHCLPRTRRQVGERINLTFRRLA